MPGRADQVARSLKRAGTSSCSLESFGFAVKKCNRDEGKLHKKLTSVIVLCYSDVQSIVH